MTLSTRLVLLLLACVLPTCAAQVFSEAVRSSDRHRQVAAAASRQAAMADAAIAGLADTLGQFAALAGQFPEIRAGNADCGERLTALRQGLGQYRWLALYSPADHVLSCASSDAPSAFAIEAPAKWVDDLISTQGTAAGHIVGSPGQGDRVLPVAVRLPTLTASGESRVMIAGVRVDWLLDHLERAGALQGPSATGAVLCVIDADGNVIGRGLDAIGSDASARQAWLGSLANRQSPGTETVSDPDGRRFALGYVPSAALRSGITVVAALPLTALSIAGERSASVHWLLLAGAAIAGPLLAWLLGRLLILRPAVALLDTARRWRDGDPRAGARPIGDAAEFGGLARAFDAMAAGLRAREAERTLQAGFLETQAAERARQLSESNNRLLVEIAGRERTEAALHQAQKLQAVGQLVGGISHDFNNMLATVLGNLELMERRVARSARNWTDGDSERLRTLIERATGAVVRGGQLTSRLLAFTRRQRLAAQPTDVNALLLEMVTLATSTLGRRVRVVPELAGDLWPALVDPSQLEAAVLNLCLNARDAMPGGGTLTIATANLTVDGQRAGEPEDRDLAPGDYVRIRISDTGCGMTRDVRDRAFEPFFTTKAPGAGSGLGLSQVLGMARQAGGSVGLQGAAGEGTEVSLSLPRAVEAACATLPRWADKAAAEPERAGELILVVDDDPAVRQVTVEMARELGYVVAQASGGEEALALVGAGGRQPRFLLLDYAMPGMNGIQLAQALRQRGLNAPVALVTGYAELSEADVEAGQLAGLLRKPFTIRELRGLMSKLGAVAQGELAATEA